MPPMIFRREMTVLCRLAGTVSILWSRPSIRIRTTISPCWGSRWMSLARSLKARSMRELTKRMVGAASASSGPETSWAGTMSPSVSPA